jgi:hypothetical protein
MVASRTNVNMQLQSAYGNRGAVGRKVRIIAIVGDGSMGYNVAELEQ